MLHPCGALWAPQTLDACLDLIDVPAEDAGTQYLLNIASQHFKPYQCQGSLDTFGEQYRILSIAEWLGHHAE